MPPWELTEAAEEDLRGIASYTISRWGPNQALRYAAVLDAHFKSIALRSARTRTFLPNRPELRVSRVESHYVFHLEREHGCPLILAVFHERMDLMVRLRARLDD